MRARCAACMLASCAHSACATPHTGGPRGMPPTPFLRTTYAVSCAIDNRDWHLGHLLLAPPGQLVPDISSGSASVHGLPSIFYSSQGFPGPGRTLAAIKVGLPWACERVCLGPTGSVAEPGTIATDLAHYIPTLTISMQADDGCCMGIAQSCPCRGLGSLSQ